LRLDTFEWEKLPGDAALLFNPIKIPVNIMSPFQGRPTVFGDLECSNNGNCVNTAVKQYYPEEGRWKKIGNMKEARTYHEVIELPRSVCYSLVEPGTGPPAVDPEAKAALVIGGSSDGSVIAAAGSGVELFGCPNSAVPIPVRDVPIGDGLALTGGIFLEGEDDDDPGSVLVCGGFGVNGDAAFETDR